ncbi:MAG: Gfo/Idh/MocA family oxidoreductase [Candidatus Baltobacteraceae bacterium]
MQHYRVGIVGAGFGLTAHLPALRAHPRFEVVALASPSTAERAAREANVPSAFTSCEAMLAGCDLDVVTVASPPFRHRDDVLAALAAGKHVLCEKPFALDVAGARAMLAAAQAAGTACGIAHEFRFVPQAQAVKELIVNGHLGPLRNIEITLLRSSLRSDSEAARSWWFDRAAGGGLGGSALSHLIDYASWLAGRAPLATKGLLRTANPRRVDASGAFVSSADDGAFALIDYGEGLVARLCADATVAVDGFTCAAHGDRRTAVASGANIVDVMLYATDAEGTDELECAPSPYAAFAGVNGNVPLLMELYDQLVKRIEGTPSALPTFEEGVATQAALAAIGYGS